MTIASTQLLKPKTWDSFFIASSSSPLNPIHQQSANLGESPSKVFANPSMSLPLSPALVRAPNISYMGYAQSFLQTLCSTLVPLQYYLHITRVIFSNNMNWILSLPH